MYWGQTILIDAHGVGVPAALACQGFSTKTLNDSLAALKPGWKIRPGDPGYLQLAQAMYPSHLFLARPEIGQVHAMQDGP